MPVITRTPRSPRWDLGGPYEVKFDEKVHLRRWRINTPWFAVLLTRIYTPDPDRAPHNHSRGFVTWILRGGYTERVWPYPLRRSSPPEGLTWAHEVVNDQVRKHRRLSLMHLPRTWAHQITDVRPGTLTLVLAGRWHGDKATGRDSWYFWTKDGPVDQKDYHTTPS